MVGKMLGRDVGSTTSPVMYSIHANTPWPRPQFCSEICMVRPVWGRLLQKRILIKEPAFGDRCLCWCSHCDASVARGARRRTSGNRKRRKTSAQGTPARLKTQQNWCPPPHPLLFSRRRLLCAYPVTSVAGEFVGSVSTKWHFHPLAWFCDWVSPFNRRLIRKRSTKCPATRTG